MPAEVSFSEEKEHPPANSPALAPERMSQPPDEISLLDLLVIIVDRKRVVLWVTVICTAIAILLALVLPARYTAKVILMPPQQNSSLAAELTSQLNGMGGVAALAGGSLGLKSPNEMFVSMLKSRTVEQGVVERFGLVQEYHARYLSDALKAFEKHATVESGDRDGLIHISLYDKDPNRAAELANGYVDEFRKLSEHLAIGEAGQRRLFFEQQLVQAKDNLANAEEALKKTEQTTGVIQLDSQARALVESAAMLRAQITAKEVQIQGLRTFATDQNAQLVEAQQELDSLQAQLAKLGGSEIGLDAGLIVPKGKVPEVGLEYIRKFRDVKYYETVFDILARQFELAKLDEAKEGAIIQVIDPAAPPDRRSFPKRTLFAIVGLVGGFLIGIGVAILLAGFERMKQDPEATAKLRYLRHNLPFSGKRGL